MRPSPYPLTVRASLLSNYGAAGDGDEDETAGYAPLQCCTLSRQEFERTVGYFRFVQRTERPNSLCVRLIKSHGKLHCNVLMLDFYHFRLSMEPVVKGSALRAIVASPRSSCPSSPKSGLSSFRSLRTMNSGTVSSSLQQQQRGPGGSAAAAAVDSSHWSWSPASFSQSPSRGDPVHPSNALDTFNNQSSTADAQQLHDALAAAASSMPNDGLSAAASPATIMMRSQPGSKSGSGAATPALQYCSQSPPPPSSSQQQQRPRLIVNATSSRPMPASLRRASVTQLQKSAAEAATAAAFASGAIGATRALKIVARKHTEIKRQVCAQTKEQVQKQQQRLQQLLRDKANKAMAMASTIAAAEAAEAAEAAAASSSSSSSESGAPARIYEKSPDARQLLVCALARNTLFAAFGGQQIASIVDAMYRIEVTNGQEIITQVCLCHHDASAVGYLTMIC